MSSELYQVFALGMRYWFALLGLLIVARAYIWLIGEHRRRHRRLHDLPDAGTIGDLKVLEDCGDLSEGMTIPLPYEGTLGSLRTDDITLNCDGIAPQHLDFSFRRGLGLLVMPRRGLTCVADGEELTSRSKPKEHTLHHGSTLEVGEVKLRIRLFAGLEEGGRGRLMDEPEDAAGMPDPQDIEQDDIEESGLENDGWDSQMPPPVSQAVPTPETVRGLNYGYIPQPPAAGTPAFRRRSDRYAGQPAEEPQQPYAIPNEEMNNSRRIAQIFGSEENDRYRRSMWRSDDEEQE